MSQIKIQATFGVAEIYDLVQMDELRCESPHSRSAWGLGDEGCSVEVTHRIDSCCGGFLICRSRADYLVRMMGRFVTCAGCDCSASERWRIVPV